MKKRPVLRSRNRRDLRLVGDVLMLTWDAKDEDGRPLFDDTVKDPYLSPNYSQKAINVLRNYGLQRLSFPVIVNLLESDLRNPDSKMYGSDTTEEWHAAVAQLLSKGNTSTQQKLKSLALLPLRSGEWTSTTSGPVYFPTTGDVGIPDSLDLKIISTSASKNSDRNAFFRYLGVCQATNDQVRASILRSFASTYMIPSLNGYLKFLYLTHKVDTHARDEYAKVQVATGALDKKSPHEMDIYLPGTDHPYSPASLLAAKDDAPGLSVAFLHSKHMEHVPDRPSPSHPSWERWLCDSIGIRERLRPVSRDGRDLSDTFLYVHKHRTDKFLGLFEHIWLFERSSVLHNRAVRSKIKDLPAKNLCGVDFSITLKESWLPSKALRELAERYMDHPEQFPFLKLDESNMTPQVSSKWNFLCDHFSVRKDDSLDFLLEILRCIERSCPRPSSDGQLQKVFDLYVAINAKLAVANNTSEAKQKITLVYTCFMQKPS